MPKVIWTAIAPYTGRAIRFEPVDGDVSFKIVEGAEKAAGESPSWAALWRETQKETIRMCLVGITTKRVPFVMKTEPLFDSEGKIVAVGGVAQTREVIDEEATIKAIESDEDAAAKGCPWMPVGYLDMITADSKNHLTKLFPQADELLEVAAIIDRAGRKPRLPLAGKARMTVG